MGMLSADEAELREEWLGNYGVQAIFDEGEDG